MKDKTTHLYVDGHERTLIFYIKRQQNRPICLLGKRKV